MMPMPANRSVKTCISEQNKIYNQEKYYRYSFIEGRSDKNFIVVNLFPGRNFAIIFFYTFM